MRQAIIPCRARTYFVTDGGAQENLGLVSALLAVRGAIETLQRECTGKSEDCRARTGVRPLHFVLAEASAVGIEYQQDCGLSAALGNAKERLTGGLAQLLIADVERRLEDLRKLNPASGSASYHYLPLPLPFRSRGGVGTHWMQAETYELSDPRVRTPASLWERLKNPGVQAAVTIDRKQLRITWNAVHSPETNFCEAPELALEEDTARVRRWVCKQAPPANPMTDLHGQAWSGIVSGLKRSDRDPGGFDCTKR